MASVDSIAFRRLLISGAFLLAPALLTHAQLPTLHAPTNPVSSQGADAKRPTPRVVNVVTNDFSFDMPDTLRAGLMTVRLRNNGKEAHHLMFFRLDDGKELRDVVSALAEPKAPPAWMHAEGGPNGVNGVREAVVTLLLPPGRYAAVCVLPSPDHIGHVAKGMTKMVTVLPSASAAEQLPPGDVTITLKEYGFALSHPLTAGRHRIAIVNAGQQLHELILIRLDSGKHSADFVKWAQSHDGPSPGERFGGITDIVPGATQLIDVDLPVGAYGLICRVRDAGDGQFHDQHGMTADITVERARR